MKINIKATNLELTPDINDYVSKKIDGLEKFIDYADSSVQAWVEIGVTTRHHQHGDIYRAEIQLHIPHEKKGVRAVSEKDALYAAIDEARDEIKRELSKIKGRKISLARKGARMFKKLIFKNYEQ